MKLGQNQQAALKSLLEFRGWHAGCGWLWDTHSSTVRLLDSLVRRGLASKTTVKSRGWLSETTTYKITEAGKEFVFGISLWHKLKYGNKT